MPLLATLLKLAHIGTAIAMVSGLLGSRLLNRQAAMAGDIEVVWRLSRAAAPFDRMAEVAGPALILTGFATAWADGRPWLGLTTGWIFASIALVAVLIVMVAAVFRPAGARVESAILAARATGTVTPQLREAYTESGARRIAALYGDLVSPAIIALMVLKPG